MDNATYKQNLGLAMSLVRSLDVIPAREMLDDLERIDTLAPILYPTEYRDGMANIEPQRKLLRAIASLQAAVADLRAELGVYDDSGEGN